MTCNIINGFRFCGTSDLRNSGPSFRVGIQSSLSTARLQQGALVVPSKDYSHGPPCFRGLFMVKSERPKPNGESKKKTMNATPKILLKSSEPIRTVEQSEPYTPTLPGLESLVAPFSFRAQPYEYKIVPLRECRTPTALALCDEPAKAAEYWRRHVEHTPYFNPECECFVVLLLNTRRKVKGHQLISIGTMDTILVHPREVFRLAIVCAASSILVMHNHPSGEAQPSEADIKVTRDLIRAGQLLRIEVMDHVIIGRPGHCSLRGLGYFAV